MCTCGLWRVFADLYKGYLGLLEYVCRGVYLEIFLNKDWLCLCCEVCRHVYLCVWGVIVTFYKLYLSVCGVLMYV